MSFIATIEIPKGSNVKYEIDKLDPYKLNVDRIINQPIPYSYGFINGTLADDGDALDVFIINDVAIQPLSIIKLEIICGLFCTDQGDNDHKVIAKVCNSEISDTITIWEDNLMVEKSLQTLDYSIQKITNYLSTYKTGFHVGPRLTKAETEFEIGQCVNMFKFGSRK